MARPKSFNDWLLLSVAELQRECASLDKEAHKLTEMADLQAHRALKSDLGNYIAAHARAGTLPHDPLATLEPRLRQLAKFFDGAAELHRTSLSLRLRSTAVSLADVQSFQATLEEAAVQLPKRLRALAALLSPQDWDGDNDGADVSHRLLTFAQELGVDLPKEASVRSTLRLLVRGRGKLFAEIEGHFKEAGNAVTNSALALARAVPADVGKVLEAFQAVAATDYRIFHHGEARQKLAAIRDALNSHWTAAMQAGELEAQCQPVLETAKSELDDAQATLASMAAAGEAKWRSKSKSRRIAVGVIAVLLLMAALSPRTTTDAEAKAASKNKAKAKAAIANPPKPTKAQIAAEAKAAAEAKIVAEAKDFAQRRAAWTAAKMRRLDFKAERRQPALAIPGTIHAWGRNGDGQSTIPSGLTNVVSIAAGYSHTIALRSDGTVYAWGLNDDGQCKVPAGLTNVVAIAGGGSHTVALKADGTVVAWGKNHRNQATPPPDLDGVVAIAAGWEFSVALKGDGRVVAWGGNESDQSKVPPGLHNVVAITTGCWHAVALKADGTVAAWGTDSQGQRTVPAGLDNVAAIAAGSYHTVALKRDGTVVAWGGNSTGQLAVPPGLNNVVAIAARDALTVATKADGTIVAWGGLNKDGQRRIPPGLKDVVAIAAGERHTFALSLP